MPYLRTQTKDIFPVVFPIYNEKISLSNVILLIYNKNGGFQRTNKYNNYILSIQKLPTLWLPWWISGWLYNFVCYNSKSRILIVQCAVTLMMQHMMSWMMKYNYICFLLDGLIESPCSEAIMKVDKLHKFMAFTVRHCVIINDMLTLV
mgnify:CR=1 FL=1